MLMKKTGVSYFWHKKYRNFTTNLRFVSVIISKPFFSELSEFFYDLNFPELVGDSGLRGVFSCYGDTYGHLWT